MDEEIIARLVLGYLRVEGCRTAYKDFLRCSRPLQSSKCLTDKYVPTRFLGLTLNDILKEYYEIYQTVQGRLEATDYYKEPHSNTSLSHQLLYLLNDKGHLSVTSTPFRSPVHSHFDHPSPIYTDHVSDVETTPAHKLPGNIRCDSEESEITKTPRKKNKSHKATDYHIIDFSDNNGSPEVVLDTEILAQTLLENKAFHEKIAQTINKVAEKKQRVSTEMDETIQTVLKETAEDPIFDKILEEIIGSANIVDNGRTQGASSTKNTGESADNSKKSQKKNDSKDYSSDQHEETTKRVEEQNAEAIQLIIDRAKTDSNGQQVNNTEKTKTLETETQTQQVTENSKSDIILFDGSLDKYIISNACNIATSVPQPQTPFVLNTTGGLLMVPSTIQTNIAAPTPTSQVYILNKPPLLNCYIPSPAVLTEKDILAMPTVILNDDRPATKPKRRPKAPNRIIHPKPVIEISTTANLSEFLTLHNHQEDAAVNKLSDSSANPNTSCNQGKYDNNLPLIDLEVPTETPIDLVESKESHDQNTENKIPNTSNTTPHQSANLKKNTPKSGSHVRNLDFLSPPKLSLTQKNNISSSETDDKKKDSKKQAAKTLFKKDEARISNSKENGKKDHEPWDAKLRAYVPKNGNSATRSPRKKKSKPKRKSKNESEDLNTTEQDAALLEAALQTPVKSEDRQTTNMDSKSDQKLPKSPSAFTNKEIRVLVQDVLENKKYFKDGTGDGLNKTVLSPSGLNASKKKLVQNTVNQTASLTVSENINTIITPETVHDSILYPIKANRNIIPMLETPVKDNLPKTPGLQTPFEFNMSSLTNYTPVTKMLEANLPGFDINLPTPNIPVTPSFPPFTPTVDLMSPYSNRPTDYSTSSSYYQPSDNEQNKSLEAHLREVEKKPVSNNAIDDSNANQHLQVFNKNVIGKKNLNLLKRTESSSSSESSTSSSDTSSDENEESMSWAEEEGNDTVICKKKGQETPRKQYSLRNRSNSVKTPTPKLSSEKEGLVATEVRSAKSTKTCPNKPNSRIPNKLSDKKRTPIDESIEESVSNIKSHMDSTANNSTTTKSSKSSKSVSGRVTKCTILKEMEEKRQRTVKSLKNGDASAIGKPKKNSGGFIKIKPIPNLSNQRRRSRKSDSPKKNIQAKIDNKTILTTLMKDLADSETEDDISLRLSVSDEDHEINLKKIQKIENTASDVEAQTLIEGLKERGIHLMHNKNTKFQSSISKLAQECPDTNGEPGNKDEEKDLTCANTSTSTETGNDKVPTMDDSLTEEFDTCLITTEINCTFDEFSTSKRTVEMCNPLELKTLTARLYIDEIEKNVDIEFKLTDFHVLLNIEPLETTSVSTNIIEASQGVCETQSSSQHGELNQKDIQEKEEPSNEPQSPTSSRKRKYQDDEESAHKEKKCKTLLLKINVDSFLNNIHGNK